MNRLQSPAIRRQMDARIIEARERGALRLGAHPARPPIPYFDYAADVPPNPEPFNTRRYAK